MVHEIFHAVSEGKEFRFFGGINITTQAHVEVLKIIVCLDSDVHKATNKTPCEFLSCFKYYTMRGLSMKSYSSNYVYIGKGDF